MKLTVETSNGVAFLRGFDMLAIVGGHFASDPKLAAVVRVGRCSGVLIAARTVVTNAHCLDGQINSILIGGTLQSVDACVRRAGYALGQPGNDFGSCRLSAPAVPSPISLDDGPELVVNEQVVLVGFGAASPLASSSEHLREVETSVVRIAPSTIDVGTSGATACRGDSGGAVLVERHGTLRLAGLIQGAVGAICASPTVAIPVHGHEEWFAHIGPPQAFGTVSGRGHMVEAGAFVGAVTSLVLIGWIWSHRQHRDV
jgi:hypothetical protein